MGARAITYYETTELFTETCCNCGVLFAIPNSYKRQRQEDHGWFYCPNGHQQHYTGESDAEKLKRIRSELDAAKSAQAFAERRLVDEQSRHGKELKRIQRRASVGVCPCCHRTVSQMARHIKTKHPEFGK